MKITKKHCVYVMALWVIIYASMQIILQVPINCHYEYGTIQKEQATNTFYFIDFINREGNNRTIWLSDSSPDKINPMTAMLEYHANSNEDLILNWCYIPSIDKERIRGAWTW